MTGRFNHNNHVYSNDKRSPLNIDLRSTIQCYIQEAGYRTAFYGKFLNGFPITFHQPCLTDYAINGGQAHEGRPISVNGTIVPPERVARRVRPGPCETLPGHRRAARPRAVVSVLRRLLSPLAVRATARA